MPDLADFFPIFVRTEEDMRTDWDVRANAGLTVDDPAWVDTRQGSMYFLATQPQIIEFAAAYDRINEAIAAAILATSWGDKLDLHAASYGDERIGASQATGVVTFNGAEGTLIGTNARVGKVQTDPEIEPPVFETTESGTIGASGTIDLPVRAILEGTDGNVAAGDITLPVTGLPGVISLTNANPTSGGAEVESDEALKKRLMLRFGGKGSGTRADYARAALGLPYVGRVKVEPNWNGPGTIRLIILDDAGNPNSAPDVAAAQAFFDPVPNQGEGWAPVNHEATVVTATAVSIYLAAAVTFKEGYSLDGEGGTVALREAIVAALDDYLQNLEPGESVLWDHVMAQFFKVEGVYDVSLDKLDKVSPPVADNDVAIAALEIAMPGAVDPYVLTTA